MDFEQTVNVRIMRGVDLNYSARLSDPGTYRETKNLYARLKGILELRPGSKLIAYQISQPSSPVTVFANGTGYGYIAHPVVSTLALGAQTQKVSGILPFSPGLLAQYASGKSTQAMGLPLGSRVQTPIDGHLNSGGFWVNSLVRSTIGQNGSTFLFGAMDSHSGDFLFYVDANNNIVPIPEDPNGTQIINSNGGMWQMAVMPINQLNDQTGQSGVNNGWQIVCVNGVDAPLAIRTGLTDTALSPAQPFGIASIKATAAVGPKTCYLVGPTCFALYGFQAIWGAPKFVSDDAQTRHRFDNFVCFSDPSNPNTVNGTVNDFAQLAKDSDGSVLLLQVGATVDEPVTAISGSPAITDSFGMQGQAVFFTPDRTVVYNGPMPSTGNPAPPGFGLASDDETGCVAPKTVVRTKYGTVYLGSDGLIRIVALNNRIEIISRALEPLLGGHTKQFYGGCCAYYSKGFYHIFFPQAVGGGILSPSSHNSLEYVCDLRSLNLGDPRDCGVEWFGPFTGRFVSCATVARTLVDNGTVYAGLGHRPAILQLECPDTFSDPNMWNLTQKVLYGFRIVTGDLDLGNIHQDKRVTAFGIALASRISQQLTGAIAPMGDGIGNAAGGAVGYSKTNTVPPNAPSLNGTFTLGTSGLSSEQNPSLPYWQPSSPIVGRSFIITYECTPTVEAPMIVSDFQFRILEKPRKATAF